MTEILSARWRWSLVAIIVSTTAGFAKGSIQDDVTVTLLRLYTDVTAGTISARERYENYPAGHYFLENIYSHSNARANADITLGSNAIVIDLQGSQNVTGGQSGGDSNARSIVSVDFSVLAPVQYEFHGHFHASSDDASDTYHMYWDIVGTSGNSAYPLHQANAGYVTDDDEDAGPATGVLQPGYYSVRYYSQITDGDFDGVGSIIGEIDAHLTLTEVESVPEPASLAVWAIGALGCGVVRLRRFLRVS